MNRSNLLKLLTVLLIVVFIVIGTKAVLAAQSIEIRSVEGSGGNTPANRANAIPTTTNEPENTTNNVVNEADNTPSNNLVSPANNVPNNVNNKTIPDTGAKSQTGLFIFMILALVSAVYTFIKVKEYNI